ncbi:MAG: metallophosphoesterase family protein [Candidatus Hydrothermarchaeales archaeon]
MGFQRHRSLGKGRKIVLIVTIALLLMGVASIPRSDKKTATIYRAVLSDEGGLTEIVTVGVISDTHIPTRSKELPAETITAFKDVDMIIHAGDIVHLEVIRDLERVAPVVAVQGNMDPSDVRKVLPEMDTVEIDAWKIGVIHDSLSPLRMRKMRKVAKDNGFDVLIFGHTHRPFIKAEKGVLYLNPGSPTDPFLARPTVALLRVGKDKIKAEIVEI